ncbi:TPA: hypothetical protein HA318_01925 [Candidatus Micrarchaeota archaeon]|nr:MAG: hypothetical protein AUJ65_03290 [Candidatus Micrarchaeota archaeon CG1_02_51_15]HII38739.1 hypothetical protein [Candidatus Micrarchaeota archaeon]
MAGGKKREKEQFKQPKPLFEKIPPVELMLRGTSTNFLHSHPERITPYYHAHPHAQTHQEWVNHFEATAHAAVERGLRHALFTDPQMLLEPEHLPAVIVIAKPSLEIENFNPKPSVKLGEPIHHQRPQYEQALVDGVSRPTFHEASHSLLSLPRSGLHAVSKTVVRLTKKEYASILSKVKGLSKERGVDFDGLVAGLMNRDIETREKSGVDGRRLVKEIMDHDMPNILAETGWHAMNPASYLIGEHVKQVLLKKVYANAEAQARKIAERTFQR